MLKFLKKTKRRMLISALLSGLNQTLWAGVVIGLLFFSFDHPPLRILFALLGFGSVFVFIVVPFFRQLSYQELLTRFLDTVPDLPPQANRIFTAALDFELYPANDSPQLRSRAIHDAETLLEPLDPYCVVPICRERISTVVSLIVVCGLWIAGEVWMVDGGLWIVRREQPAHHTPRITPPSPQITIHNSQSTPPPPLPDGHGSDTPPLPTIVEQQVSLFLRTKKEFLSLLGKSHLQLTREKRQLLDAMSQRQKMISLNQDDAVKEQMLENADHFAANRLGLSLQLQREILTALGRDPDKDYEKEGITPFAPGSGNGGLVDSGQWTVDSGGLVDSDLPAPSVSAGEAVNSENRQGTGGEQGMGNGEWRMENHSRDRQETEERYSGLWGELPQNERQIGHQAAREQVIPEYQGAVERYYRTLFFSGQ